MVSYIEGLDYYIENGKWVFTSHFLLQRGYCCRSNCRHCPYGDKMNIIPGQYIWKNKDFDMPVKVLESLGKGQDGRVYVKIEGSNSAVPADELVKEAFGQSRKPTSRRLFG